MAEARPTDLVVTEAYELSRDYIAYVTGRASGTAPTPTAHALRHAGDELLEKFPIFFKRWARIFSGVTEDTACDLLIQTIDDNLMDFFERQKRQTGYQPDIPWSMVLSIYVLAGQMAIYCQEHGMEKALEPLAERVGRYVEENICPAIKKKDGWAGFTERYGKKANMEGKVLKMCSIVLATLSALLLSYFLWKRRISSV